MPLTIVRLDITKMKVDAIVNAANVQLQMGGGVCGAIFRAAGAKALQAACDGLSPIRTGEAVVTPGFGLPAKFVIHTAGPVYQEGEQGEDELLRACYINSLRLAIENDCETVAFPLISSGIYGYPKPRALGVATKAIRECLNEYDLQVYLSVFCRESFSTARDLSLKDAVGHHPRWTREHQQGIQRWLCQVEGLAEKGKEGLRVRFLWQDPLCGAGSGWTSALCFYCCENARHDS